jgi:hypothetical protein
MNLVAAKYAGLLSAPGMQKARQRAGLALIPS